MADENKPAYEYYLKYKQYSSYRNRFNVYVSDDWKSEKNKTVRRGLLFSLLNNPCYVSYEIKGNNELIAMVKVGFATPDDVYQVVSKLPNSHSRKASFLCQKAKLIVRRENDIERSDKTFAEALKLAKLQKNKVTANSVLLNRAFMLGYAGLGERARKWSDQIDRDQLDDDSRAYFDKSKKIWDKPDQEDEK